MGSLGWLRRVGPVPTRLPRSATLAWLCASVNRQHYPAPWSLPPVQDLTLRYNVDSYMDQKGLPKLRQFRWAAAPPGRHLHVTYKCDTAHQQTCPERNQKIAAVHAQWLPAYATCWPSAAAMSGTTSSWRTPRSGTTPAQPPSRSTLKSASSVAGELVLLAGWQVASLPI